MGKGLSGESDPSHLLSPLPSAFLSSVSFFSLIFVSLSLSSPLPFFPPLFFSSLFSFS